MRPRRVLRGWWGAAAPFGKVARGRQCLRREQVVCSIEDASHCVLLTNFTVQSYVFFAVCIVHHREVPNWRIHMQSNSKCEPSRALHCFVGLRARRLRRCQPLHFVIRFCNAIAFSICINIMRCALQGSGKIARRVDGAIFWAHSHLSFFRRWMHCVGMLSRVEFQRAAWTI